MTRRSQAELEAMRMLAWEQVRRDYVERARQRAERVERGEPVSPPEVDPYYDEVPPPEVRRAIERRRSR